MYTQVFPVQKCPRKINESLISRNSGLKNKSRHFILLNILKKTRNWLLVNLDKPQKLQVKLQYSRKDPNQHFQSNKIVKRRL